VLWRNRRLPTFRRSDKLRQPATPPAPRPPALASYGIKDAVSHSYEFNCADELAKAVYNCGSGSAVLAPFRSSAIGRTVHELEWDFLAEVPGDTLFDSQTFAACLRPTNGGVAPQAVQRDALSSPPVSAAPSPQKGASPVPQAAVVFEFSSDSGLWEDKLVQLEKRLEKLHEAKTPVLLAGLGFPDNAPFPAIGDRVQSKVPSLPARKKNKKKKQRSKVATAGPLPRCLELHNEGRLCVLHCTRTFVEEQTSVSQGSARLLKELSAKQDLTTALLAQLVAALGLRDDAL
jgi:hypothetical protein